jgi:hypothetical protein
METIVVYYEGNKNAGLENQIKEMAQGHQGFVKDDFNYENQVHQAVICLKNSGNLKNFESDLKRLASVFNTKVYIGGYLA